LPTKDDLSSEAQQQLTLQTALSTRYLSEPGTLGAMQAILALHTTNLTTVTFYEHYSDNARRTHKDNNDDDAVEPCSSWVD
jgi:hypothetical protein